MSSVMRLLLGVVGAGGASRAAGARHSTSAGPALVLSMLNPLPLLFALSSDFLQAPLAMLPRPFRRNDRS